MTDVLTHGPLEDRIRRSIRDHAALTEILRDARHADIADAIDRLHPAARAVAFSLLDDHAAAEVLDELSPESTRQVLESIGHDRAAHLLNLLPMDDAAEVLSEDVPHLSDELLGRMRPSDAAEVRGLLAYPPKTAGRLMTERYAHVHEDMTAADTLVHLRAINADIETMTNVYAVDEGRRLTGVAALRDVVGADPHAPLATILTRDVISVRPETDQEDVARVVSKYDFLAVPVVDDDGLMLGIVTVDDIIDVLVEESTEDMLRMGGVEGGAALNQPYFTVPIRRVVLRRFWWLLLLFVAETATGSVLRVFQDELAAVVALSFFIPLLIGTGGNTGAQTVSTLIRGLALKEIVPRDIFRVIRREVVSGLVLGMMLGAVGFGRALLWHSSVRLSMVVGLTLVAVVTWANTIGALIPIVAQRVRIDPAIVSAPLITTLVDATGLMIYLLIAKSLLHL